MLALLMPEILDRLLFSEAEKDATLHKGINIYLYAESWIVLR